MFASVGDCLVGNQEWLQGQQQGEVPTLPMKLLRAGYIHQVSGLLPAEKRQTKGEGKDMWRALLDDSFPQFSECLCSICGSQRFDLNDRVPLLKPCLFDRLWLKHFAYVLALGYSSDCSFWVWDCWTVKFWWQNDQRWYLWSMVHSVNYCTVSNFATLNRWHFLKLLQSFTLTQSRY